jgi:hypothetical protein
MVRLPFPDLLWQDVGEQGGVSQDSTRVRYRPRQDSLSPSWPEQGRPHWRQEALQPEAVAYLHSEHAGVSDRHGGLFWRALFGVTTPNVKNRTLRLLSRILESMEASGRNRCIESILGERRNRQSPANSCALGIQATAKNKHPETV